MSPTFRARARRRYERWAPLIVVLIGLTAAAGIWIGASALVAGAQQQARNDVANRARDAKLAAVAEENRKLLECFDKYADAQSSGSQIVREASAVQGDTLRAAVGELGHVFRMVLQGKLQGIEDLRPFVTAADAFEAASERLDQARAENPVPEPPSVFCAD